MGELDGRTVLITGATDGLGLELARRCAAEGATVIAHGRDRRRLDGALEAIGGAGAARPRGALADLARLDEARALAGEVAGGGGRLDALVNNAGVAPGRRRRESADGHELALAVNHLAHFLLTLELMPLLRDCAPTRVVSVASAGQAAIDFDDPMLERSYDGFRAYAQSKLAQVMFTLELAERLERAGESGVAVNALHPATLMDTKMVRESFGRARSSVAEGVESTWRLLAAPELDGVSGRYFDRDRESAADPQAYEPAARGRLWALSEDLCGVRSPV